MELNKETLIKSALLLVGIVVLLSVLPTNDSNGIIMGHDGEYSAPVYYESDFEANYNEANYIYGEIIVRDEAGEFDGDYEEYQAFEEVYENWGDYSYPARMAYRESTNETFLEEYEDEYLELNEQGKTLFEMDWEYYERPDDI